MSYKKVPSIKSLNDKKLKSNQLKIHKERTKNLFTFWTSLENMEIMNKLMKNFK